MNFIWRLRILRLSFCKDILQYLTLKVLLISKTSEFFFEVAEMTFQKTMLVHLCVEKIINFKLITLMLLSTSTLIVL